MSLLLLGERPTKLKNENPKLANYPFAFCSVLAYPNRMVNKTRFDVIVLGGGAAGLMCAIEAGRRGRSVLVIDHAKKPAEKIRISGGGRCNFTNIHSGPQNFLSANKHFFKSALKRYTQHDFINLVEKHKIAYHEKALGQLFCDDSAKNIIEMLLVELAAAGGELWLQTAISHVDKSPDGFVVETSAGQLNCQSLVVATGGKSIPKMGATGLGYEIAQQFGLAIIDPRPALVPFTYPADLIDKWRNLAGIALNVRAKIASTIFEEAMLITHRGLSGPAILQISSYWREGDSIELDLLPDHDIAAHLKSARQDRPKAGIVTALEGLLPKAFAQHVCRETKLDDMRLADLPNKALEKCAHYLHHHTFTPGGTEGYRTAEVTLGGVDTSFISQKTMEANDIPGLYFIGEVVDVTGHLGGHNFQWAWSSGHAAGQAV